MVVYGEAGNDTIRIRYYDSTANGGIGDDLIYLNSNNKGNVVEYANGDGNDTVDGFGSSSLEFNNIIKIVNGTVSSITGSGNDVCLTVGTGSNFFKNVKDTPVQYKEENASLKTIYYDGNKVYDAICRSRNSSKITGTDLDDLIYDSTGWLTINAGLGNR